jgi:hypothetical protein
MSVQLFYTMHMAECKTSYHHNYYIKQDFCVCHVNGWSENPFAIGRLLHCELSDMIGQFGQWQARTLQLTMTTTGWTKRKIQLGGCTKLN